MYTEKTEKTLDMALAKTYKPILLCIGKLSILLGFQYAASFVLFPAERYAIIGALLYIDRWLKSEYIIDTNAVVCAVVVSLLVHELRGMDVQARIHHPRVHDTVLFVFVACNIAVLSFGENFHENWSVPALKIYRSSSNSATGARIGSLLWLLCTCLALVILSTCAMPASSQDVLLKNIRVWVFTILCLAWFFSINHANLSYSTVAPFTPCLLRFSSILFFPSLVWTLVGATVLTACLVVTNLRLVHERGYFPDDCFNRHETPGLIQGKTNCYRPRSPNSPTENRQPPFHTGFRTTPSLRPGIYRDPLAGTTGQSVGHVARKFEPKTVPVGDVLSISHGPEEIGGQFPRAPTGNEQDPQTSGSQTRFEYTTVLTLSPTDTGFNVPSTGVDYNSLFEQASLDHVA